MFQIKLEPKARRYLDDLQGRFPENWERCWRDLLELERDPFRARPGVDIRRWRGKKPPGFYRKREGRHRFVYRVLEKERVVDVVTAGFK